MNTVEEILKLIETNPGVDLEKVREALEQARANGVTPPGYRLASPLDAHRYKVRVQDPDQTVKLRTRKL